MADKLNSNTDHVCLLLLTLKLDEALISEALSKQKALPNNSNTNSTAIDKKQELTNKASKYKTTTQMRSNKTRCKHKQTLIGCLGSWSRQKQRVGRFTAPAKSCGRNATCRKLQNQS